jgi:NHL repeat-containing protein
MAVAGEISTIAGGVGGPGKGTKVSLVPVIGSVAYGNGDVYIFDSTCVRVLNPQNDWLTTLAGTGASIGPLGDGSPAAKVSMPSASQGVVDSAGNVLITDTDDQRIRVVAARTGTFYGQPMIGGDIYTVVGKGTQGFSGDGGPATSAELSDPAAVAVDGLGNLVIDDSSNNRIRVVAESTGTFYGQAMTAGDIYTVAGNGTYGYASDGGPATSAELGSPLGVAVDGTGNLLVADSDNARIRVVAAHTGIFYGQVMTAGNIYTVAGDGTGGFSGDGGPATAAELRLPGDVQVDGMGNLVIADTNNARIRVVAARTGSFYGQPMTGGDIYTVAGNGTYGSSGDGGPATSAELAYPYGVALDGSGNLVIGDTYKGRVRLVATRTGTFYGRAMTAGDIYTVAGIDTTGFSGQGGPALRARLDTPRGITLDRSGNTVIAGTGENMVIVVAAHTGKYYGRSMTAGDTYIVAGNGTQGFSGNGGLATRAMLSSPGDVAADGAGNLVIADTGNNRIRVIAESAGTFYGKAMTPGHIYTVAGTGGPRVLSEPAGVAVDAAGNLVIAATGNNRIEVLAESTGTFYGQPMTAGHTYAVAGDGKYGFSGDDGPATAAELRLPGQVAVDSAGNLILADSYNNRVRVVAESTRMFYGQAMTAGDIYTIAGGGTSGLGDGGPATAAELSLPEDITLDSGGNVAIADSNNNRVRVAAESTGTFYGQPMTAGDIYTVAGNGTYGYAGDGGLAPSAELADPRGLVGDGTGDLLIADTPNNRIRELTGP